MIKALVKLCIPVWMQTFIRRSITSEILKIITPYTGKISQTH